MDLDANPRSQLQGCDNCLPWTTVMRNTQSILIIGAISIMTFFVVTLIGAGNGHLNMKNATPFLGNEGPLSSSSEEKRSIKAVPVVPVKAPRAAGGFAIL